MNAPNPHLTNSRSALPPNSGLVVTSEHSQSFISAKTSALSTTAPPLIPAFTYRSSAPLTHRTDSNLSVEDACVPAWRLLANMTGPPDLSPAELRIWQRETSALLRAIRDEIGRLDTIRAHWGYFISILATHIAAWDSIRFFVLAIIGVSVVGNLVSLAAFRAMHTAKRPVYPYQVACQYCTQKGFGSLWSSQ